MASGVPKSQFQRSEYVRRAPILEDADCFDARFFNYSPLEAETMDPQQRIFLEVCWEALEHGGYCPGSIEGSVGVFAGSAMNTYLLNAGLVPKFRSDYLPTLIGNDKDYLATRVAFKFTRNTDLEALSGIDKGKDLHNSCEPNLSKHDRPFWHF